MTDSSYMNSLNQFAGNLNKVVETLLGINMILLTVVVFAQVFFRYILRDPLPWSAEVARYLFISVVFLGLGSAYRRGEHLGFTVLLNYTNKRWTSIILIIIHVLVLLLMIVIAIFGYDAAVHANRQISPGLRIRMSIPYALVPIGSILLIIQIMPILLKELNSFLFEKKPPEIEA